MVHRDRYGRLCRCHCHCRDPYLLPYLGIKATASSVGTLGFPKIRGTLSGVLIIRIIVFWGLYWGPPIIGNYQISKELLSLNG